MHNRHFSVSLAVNRKPIETNASGKIIVCYSVWRYCNNLNANMLRLTSVTCKNVCMHVSVSIENDFNNHKTFANRIEHISRIAMHNRATNHKFWIRKHALNGTESRRHCEHINQASFFATILRTNRISGKRTKKQAKRQIGKMYYRIGIARFLLTI